MIFSYSGRQCDVGHYWMSSLTFTFVHFIVPKINCTRSLFCCCTFAPFGLKVWVQTVTPDSGREDGSGRHPLQRGVRDHQHHDPNRRAQVSVQRADSGAAETNVLRLHQNRPLRQCQKFLHWRQRQWVVTFGVHAGFFNDIFLHKSQIRLSLVTGKVHRFQCQTVTNQHPYMKERWIKMDINSSQF